MRNEKKKRPKKLFWPKIIVVLKHMYGTEELSVG